MILESKLRVSRCTRVKKIVSKLDVEQKYKLAERIRGKSVRQI